QGAQPADGDQVQRRGDGVQTDESDAAGNAAQRQPGVTNPEGQQVRPLGAAPQLPAQTAYRQYQPGDDQTQAGPAISECIAQPGQQQGDDCQAQQDDQRCFQARLQPRLQFHAALFQGDGRRRSDQAAPNEAHQ